MANHNLPTLTSTYSNFVSELDARLDDLAVGMDPAVTTVTNPPANSIRWNSADKKWEKWSGTAWNELSANYAINLQGPSTVSANSTGDALKITQTGTGNALVVEDSGSPDSTPVVIDSNGRIIAGATSSTSTGIGEYLVQIAGGSVPLSLQRSAVSSTPINLEFAKARGNGLPGATIINGDSIGRIDFRGSDGSALLSAAFIDGQSDGVVGTGSMPGRLVFSTAPSGSGTPVERMRITSGGASVFSGDVRTTTVVTQNTVPTNTNTSATLTAGTLRQGLRVGTPTAAIIYTLPTGTNMDLAFNSLENNMAFEWSVINLASATHTITLQANADHTVVGNMVVAANSSGRFLTRKTTTNTFITYRIA